MLNIRFPWNLCSCAERTRQLDGPSNGSRLDTGLSIFRLVGRPHRISLPFGEIKLINRLRFIYNNRNIGIDVAVHENVQSISNKHSACESNSLQNIIFVMFIIIQGNYNFFFFIYTSPHTFLILHGVFCQTLQV